MITPSEGLGPENTAGDGGPEGVLADELQYQQELARQRVNQREQQRLATQEKLHRPVGLVEVNDPVRVAQRLDRVTRYLSGGTQRNRRPRHRLRRCWAALPSDWEPPHPSSSSPPGRRSRCWSASSTPRTSSTSATSRPASRPSAAWAG